MIEVKLQFSSVTELLGFFGSAAAMDNTAAIANTIAAPAAAAEKAAPAPKPDKAAKTPKAADTPPTAATAPTAAPETPPPAVTTIELPYPPIGDKIAQLVAKDRGAAVAILATFFGADGLPCKKGPQVLPADYPALNAKLDAALAEGDLA